MLVSAGILSAHDFKPYTVIDLTLVLRLQANRNRYAPISGYTPGNVAVFGNSITQPNTFWKPFGDPFVDSLADTGVVAGTNWESYIVNKTNMYYCAVSGYTIDDGLGCIDTALVGLRPEVVVCMYGTNDMWRSDTAYFKAGYRTYLQKILDRGTIPLICTIPPVTYNDEGKVAMYNRAIADLAAEKEVVMVDYWQAVIDYTDTVLVAGGQWYEDAVHPSSCEVPGLTNITEPACGQGIHNAVVWEAVNKVYRQVIDLGAGIRVSAQRPDINQKLRVFQMGNLLVIKNGRDIRISCIDGKTVYTRNGPATDRVVDITGWKSGVYVVSDAYGLLLKYIH